MLSVGYYVAGDASAFFVLICVLAGAGPCFWLTSLNGYPDNMRRMIAETGIKRARLAGPGAAPKRERHTDDPIYSCCQLYTENFGNTIAESLGLGIPVITTKGAPWEGLEARRCGWWVDQGASPWLRHSI